MPTDVRCHVDTDQAYPVLRLVGQLDAAGSERVRSALLNTLLGQPRAVVIDVSGLRVTDRDALEAVAEVTRQAADWAVVPIVVCAPPADAEHLWSGTGLPVLPTRQAALGELTGLGPDRRLSLDLEPVVGAARRARELVTEACARWDLPDLVGPGCIVVTELVNNVVAHVRSPMTVRLAAGRDALAVAVQDASSTPPKFGGPVAPTSYGGRGLLLIDSVARRWGSVPLDDGKLTWAVLCTDDTVTAGAGADGRVNGGQRSPANPPAG